MGSVRFILGRAGTGKTHAIGQEIGEALREDPLGPPIVVLVPDQATLLYEKLVVSAAPGGAQCRVLVCSFRGLGRLIVNEAGGVAVPEVTRSGRRMLLARVLREVEDQLVYFRRSARQPGLAVVLDEALEELDQAGLDDDRLVDLIGRLESTEPMSAKLADLRLIRLAYERVLGAKRLDPVRRQAMVARSARRSPTIGGCRLYVDAFTSFRQSELDLLGECAAAASHTTVALTLDPDHPALDGSHSVVETDPFRRVVQAHRILRSALEASGVREMTTLPLLKPVRFESQALAHLERVLTAPTPVPASTDASAVELIEASTRSGEADAVARRILDFAMAGGRYRDVVVLARDVGEYVHEISRSFADHGIAFFLDRARPAGHHPFVQVMRSLLDMLARGIHTREVLALLKSGLTPVPGIDSEALENYVLAHAIDGRVWVDERSWDLIDRAEAEGVVRVEPPPPGAIAARRLIGELLDSIASIDRREPRPARAWVEIVRSWLGLLGAVERINDRADEIEPTQPELAAQHRQIVGDLDELLSEAVEVLGDERLSAAEFVNTVAGAMRDLDLAIIPPTVDQVVVGSVDRTRVADAELVCVLGLNEGQFPRRSEPHAVLGDRDRDLLEGRGIFTAPGARRRQFDELLLAYSAFTLARRRLVVTRSHVGEHGADTSPSIIWQQVLGSLPSIRVTREPDDLISTKRKAAAATLRRARATDARNVDARSLGLASDPIAYNNDASLSEPVHRRLVTPTLRTSVTRLQTFAACPFKHFASHVLGLRERREADLDAVELGNVYHELLEGVMGGSTAASPQTLAEAARVIGERLREQFVLAVGREQLIVESLVSDVGRIMAWQGEVVSRGGLRPRAFEVSFGKNDGDALPPVVIETPRGRRVELVGRIDRVDADGPLALVIDYKPKVKGAIDYNALYLGIAMQLVTYLVVLRQHGAQVDGVESKARPAGALLVAQRTEAVLVDHPSKLAEKPPKAAARGIVREEAASAIDPGFPEEPLFLPKHRLSEGTIVRSDLIRSDAFDAVVDWSQRKIGELADDLGAGRIEVRPYLMRGNTPCRFCEVRAVCRFERELNPYKVVDAQKPADMVAQIMKEVQGE
jgi:ATP-dependent helicase/nuclease subunit B